MAYPTKYELSYDFSSFQGYHPTTPLPADKLEIEFVNLQRTTDEIIEKMKIIQRADGFLQNGVVTPESLTADAQTLIAYGKIINDNDVDAIAALSALSASATSAASNAALSATVAAGSATAANQSYADATEAATEAAGSASDAASSAQDAADAANDIPAAVAAAIADYLAANLIYFPTTGDVQPTFKAVAPSGWVMMDDGTIGNAASGATTRANADTEALFALLWTNVSDTYAAVSGGRGASAAADYAANKTIALTKQLGRALGVAGAGSGLTSRALGATVGTETHTLTINQISSHRHFTLADVAATSSAPTSTTKVARWSNAGLGNNDYRLQQTSTEATVGLSSAEGGGQAHNNMQPTSFLNVMIKL